MSKKLSLVNTSASSLKEVWECGFVRHWLQDIVSAVAIGLRCSIFRSLPWCSLRGDFSVSIAYQEKKEKSSYPEGQLLKSVRQLEFSELFYSNGGSEISIISTIFSEASTGLPGPLANPNRTAKSGLVTIVIQNKATRQIIVIKVTFIAFFIQSHSFVKFKLFNRL